MNWYDRTENSEDGLSDLEALIEKAIQAIAQAEDDERQNLGVEAYKLARRLYSRWVKAGKPEDETQERFHVCVTKLMHDIFGLPREATDAV